MKAIVLTSVNNLELKDVPELDEVVQNHLIIKMQRCGINSGDKLFISGAFPRGIPISKYNIAGVSGVGEVIATGQGVPDYYKNKNVVIYRSLKSSNEAIGTWSEYSHLHYLNCAVLPDSVNPEQYSGSLVNIITPYTFFKQIRQEGHTSLICTAGNSATGIVMLGLCAINNFPIISIVRNEKAKKELEKIGAKYVLSQSEPDFKQQFEKISEQLNASVVFDGVGGKTLSNIIDILPFNCIIYAYGFLDKETQFSFHTTSLMRGTIIKGFSNFRTSTVMDSEKLENALIDISKIIHEEYFKTKIGRLFPLAAMLSKIFFIVLINSKNILYWTD